MDTPPSPHHAPDDLAARIPARLAHDSFGTIAVQAGALWGAQTARSLQFFAIGMPAEGRCAVQQGGQRMPLAIIHALADVKRAAAEVNQGLGLLAPAKAAAIAAAAAQVAAGRWDAQFPLSVWQTGSGTQSHMNVNEVLATLAGAALGNGQTVHPNDDVNLGQSSNDVFPTAMHVAVVLALRPLLAALARLRAALQGQALALAGVVKTGRTHLQDATPVTLGMEFSAFDAQLGLAADAVRASQPALHALAIGGTAVGTGLNTHLQFGTRVAAALAVRLGAPFCVAPNLLAAMAGHEPLVLLHSALRLLAVALTKIANDIRLLGSGPRAGIGELRLPANEPGSSIMPGKVNPTQAEALLMVCAQVMGHDLAIGIAASQGQLELNTCKPVIALDVLDSLQLLGDAMDGFARYCVAGIEADAERCQALLGRSLMLVTALVPHIGYARAAAIAAQAQASGSSLREAAIGSGAVSAVDFDAWVQPAAMLGPLPA